MTKETVKMMKLTAAAGMTLTNGETFGKTIFLGVNDRADNWQEITDAEAEALRKDTVPEGENGYV